MNNDTEKIILKSDMSSGLYFILFITHLKLGLSMAKTHLGLTAFSVISLSVLSIVLLVFIACLNSIFYNKPIKFSLVTKCLIGIQFSLIIYIICIALFNLHLELEVIIQEFAKVIAAFSSLFAGKELLTLSMNNSSQNPPGNVGANPVYTPSNPRRMTLGSN